MWQHLCVVHRARLVETVSSIRNIPAHFAAVHRGRRENICTDSSSDSHQPNQPTHPNHPTHSNHLNDSNGSNHPNGPSC